MARTASGSAPPAFLQPMAARVVAALPEGDEWIYEVKLDGYRALVVKDGDRIRIRSRNDKDLTRAYPAVAAAAARVRAARALLDGEIVAVDGEGRPSFQALQHRSAHPEHAVVFFAFDLLHLDSEDLRGRPLAARRAALAPLLADSGLLLSIELPGSPSQVVEAVRGLGLEGVIAKRKDSPYIAGDRHAAWVKLKLDRQQEFVIGGYRPGPNGLDAILVGYYEQGRLHFAGKVRAGFTPHLRRDVQAALERLPAPACPFEDLPSRRPSRWGGGVTPAQMQEMRWVAPRLVVQVRFVEWTGDGHLRHAAFLGLRTDKRPRDVRREPSGASAAASD